MRQAHIRLAAAAAGVLAVAVGVTTAFVVGRDKPAQPAAVASPTTTSVAPGTGTEAAPRVGPGTQDHAPATPPPAEPGQGGQGRRRRLPA